jgi:hypothetical protein
MFYCNIIYAAVQHLLSIFTSELSLKTQIQKRHTKYNIGEFIMEIVLVVIVIGLLGYWAYTNLNKEKSNEPHPLDTFTKPVETAAPAPVAEPVRVEAVEPAPKPKRAPAVKKPAAPRAPAKPRAKKTPTT